MNRWISWRHMKGGTFGWAAMTSKADLSSPMASVEPARRVVPKKVLADVEWKAGVCAALGVDPSTFWPRLRAKVRTFADLRPELVGAVEQLIDFVAPPPD